MLIQELRNALDAGDLVRIVQAIKQLRLSFVGEYGKYGEAADWLYSIECQADEFPTGPERQYWNKAALERLDAELARLYSDVPSDALKYLDEIEKLTKENPRRSY